MRPPPPQLRRGRRAVHRDRPEAEEDMLKRGLALPVRGPRCGGMIHAASPGAGTICAVLQCCGLNMME